MSKAEGEVALGLIADVLIDVGNYLTLPGFESLILTHIFLGRPEKPITMDVFVNQSTVALGLSRCFIKLNCKMWVKDRA